jgi:HEAT repeat protein
MNDNRLQESRRSAQTSSRRISLIVLAPALFLWVLFAEARGQEAERPPGQLRKELLSRLTSGDVEQRIDAITQIGALRHDTSDSDQLPINTALGNSLQQDTSPVVRALAARALGIAAGNQGHSQSNSIAVAALLAAIGKERETAVRKAIIYALACYPQPQVTTALIPFLKDKKREVRAATAYALAESGDPASSQALVEVLRRGDKDDDAFARSQAARGLGRIGERDAIDPLIMALTRDRSQEVRREAAQSLGRIATRQDANVIEALRGATLSNDPYLVTAAENAIASINARDL